MEHVVNKYFLKKKHTHTHPRARAHTHPHIHARTRARAHTHTRADTHTCAHAHARTHTHTQTKPTNQPTSMLCRCKETPKLSRKFTVSDLSYMNKVHDFFEVRHPRFVSQITKYKVGTWSENNCILYIANDGKQVTTTCFGLQKGHLQVVHLVKRAVQLFSLNVQPEDGLFRGWNM